MSWKGFTKAVNRLPAVISKNTGGLTETKDEEYLALEEIFNLMDKACRNLSKDAKVFKDGLSVMLAHQESVSREFVQIYEPIDSVFTLDKDTNHTSKISEQKQRAAQLFGSAMQSARETLSGELEQIERLVVGPVGNLVDLLDIIKKTMTKRSHKLLDYDRFKASYTALRDKQSRTVSDEKKLAQVELQYETATREYESLNRLLIEDLKRFLSLRQDFIDPVLLTFFHYQIRVYQTLYAIFYEVANSEFDLSTSALGGYEDKQEAVEQMLKSLGICQPLARIAIQRPSDVEINQNESLPAYAALPPTQQSRASHEIPRNADLAVPPPRPARKSFDIEKSNYVVALYDFTAQAPGDLSFRKDQKIELVERKDNINDWWVGRIGNQVGQFPGNYVKDLN